MSNIVMFEDIFVVDKIDPDGKKFDRVSRIEAHSMNCDMFMHLDVNIELYPMAANDKFTMVLAHALNLDGTPDTGYYTQGERKTLADKYEYVMHGKLFKISEEGLQKPFKTEMYISFGGLLMMLRGESNCVSVRARSEGVSSYKEAVKCNIVRVCTLCVLFAMNLHRDVVNCQNANYFHHHISVLNYT